MFDLVNKIKKLLCVYFLFFAILSPQWHTISIRQHKDKSYLANSQSFYLVNIKYYQHFFEHQNHPLSTIKQSFSVFSTTTESSYQQPDSKVTNK